MIQEVFSYIQIYHLYTISRPIRKVSNGFHLFLTTLACPQNSRIATNANQHMHSKSVQNPPLLQLDILN